MNEKTYSALVMHIRSISHIAANLETVVTLAQDLRAKGDKERDDTGGAITDATEDMLDHLDKALEILVVSRARIAKMMKLCHHELDFAEAERARLADRGDSAGGR
jgi:hypothetical protein